MPVSARLYLPPHVSQRWTALAADGVDDCRVIETQRLVHHATLGETCTTARGHEMSTQRLVRQAVQLRRSLDDPAEAEYRRQKTEVERDLAMLPDDDKLVLFDRHRTLMISMAENVAAATPEQLRELILMLVERAETKDRGLGTVKWTGPARPFFAVVAMAPPDGLGALTASAEERLAAYL
jgi:hypothetical protein